MVVCAELISRKNITADSDEVHHDSSDLMLSFCLCGSGAKSYTTAYYSGGCFPQARPYHKSYRVLGSFLSAGKSRACQSPRSSHLQYYSSRATVFSVAWLMGQ